MGIPFSFDYTGDASAHSIASLLPANYPPRAKWFQVTIKSGSGPEYIGDQNMHDDGTGGYEFSTAGSGQFAPPVAELTGNYDLTTWKISVKNADVVNILYVL